MMNYSLIDLFEQIHRIERKVDASIELLTLQLGATTPVAVESDFTDIKGASVEIGKAVATIYGMVNRNEIPFMKRGKKLYFSRKQLRSWITETRNTTVEECKAEVYAELKSKKRI